jgi:hypothetical protein
MSTKELFVLAQENQIYIFSFYLLPPDSCGLGAGEDLNKNTINFACEIFHKIL